MPKAPQDHKSKADAESEVEGDFTFEHEGVTFTSSQNLSDVITPGFIRRHRRLPEVDLYFTMIEELFSGNKAAIGVIDGMKWDEVGKLTERLQKHMQTTLGASLGE